MIILSLGSNIRNRKQHLEKAIDKLKLSCFEITSISSVYETEPIGFKEQDEFLNLVLTGEYNGSPEKLLEEIHRIENSLGRERKFKDSPRTLDIDIIAFDDKAVSTSELTIPHKEWKNRKFVLEPLNEIDPEIIIGGVKVSEALERCNDSSKAVKLYRLKHK